jgi:hypothetical protein
MTTAMEMRILVENFYDIQKIRVETFNRIVSFIKHNKQKIIEELNRKRLESQKGSASHELNESQKGSASQVIDAIHNHYASQNKAETQLGSASHKTVETQLLNASQMLNEAHDQIASHIFRGSHGNLASQVESAFDLAFKLLKEKKYSEFVKKFVVSPKKKRLIEIDEIKNIIWFYERLYETEKELYKMLDSWSRNHPLRTKYLNKVKGIGAAFSSGIIAWLCDPILKADKVSQIWKYCGLYPGSERRRGKKLNYNPTLKTFCWKIGQSFIKFKCFGRKIYDAYKEEVKAKHPNWTKKHIQYSASQRTVKLFIASVWEVWRKMNKLPVTEPYSISILGHSGKIRPEMWLEKKTAED